MLVAVMMTALAGTAWAEEVKFSFNELYQNGTKVTQKTIIGTKGGSLTFTDQSQNFSILLTRNSGNQPGYYTKDGYLRFYGEDTFKLSAGSGITMTKIKIVVTSNGSSFSVAQMTGLDKNTKTWTGSASEVTFTGSGTNKWDKITITYSTGGTPTCAAPTFSPAAGTYTSAQNVTLSTETADATIYYTTDGSDPTASSSVYSSAIPVSSTTTIKAMAVKAGMDNSSVASATYTIVSLDHAGTEADPYTVADARTLLTAAPSTTFEDVYVSGIISQVDSYNSTYKSITYWISDDGTTTDQFEVYSGKGLNGADFSSKDDLIVGSEVTVKGNIKKYNSTFEFDVNSQIVSLVEPTYPIINVENATFNLAYNATSGEITYTIDNQTDATLTAALTNGDWISNVTVDAVNNKVTFTATANEGDADRTATITLSYTDAADKVVTVTQGHYVADYATLPFSFDGGKAAIENTAGLTETGLGTDYGSAPLLKFDSTDDELILKINERPGVLTFDIKGNGFSGGTFKVQTSADGETYSDVATYTTLSGSAETMRISNLGENVRYIKWVYTEKSSGNVALGNITLAKYVIPEYYTLSWTAGEHSELFVFDAEDDSEPLTSGVSVTEGATIYVSVGADEGYESSLTVKDADDNDVTLTEITAGSYYSFTMPASNVTITATAVEYVAPVTASYVLATSITSGKTYVIANADGTKVMGKTQNTNNRASVDATLNGTTLTAADACEFTVVLVEEGKYSFYDAVNDGYLYAASSSSNHLKTQSTLDDNGKWTIEIDEEGAATIKAQGTNTRNWLRYNESSHIFSCYSSGQQDIYLFEKVEAPASQSVTLNSYGFATFSSSNAVTIPEDGDFTAWQITAIDGNKITFEKVTGNVAAREGLFLKGTAGATVTIEAAASGNELSTNKLVGFPVSTSIQDGEYYGLSGQNFVKVNAGNVKAGKALLPASYVTSTGGGVKAFTFVFEDDATSIGEELRVKSEETEGVVYNLAGQRLQKMQKGINIVGGKKILY